MDLKDVQSAFIKSPTHDISLDQVETAFEPYDSWVLEHVSLFLDRLEELDWEENVAWFVKDTVTSDNGVLNSAVDFWNTDILNTTSILMKYWIFFLYEYRQWCCYALSRSHISTWNWIHKLAMRLWLETAIRSPWCPGGRTEEQKSSKPSILSGIPMHHHCEAHIWQWAKISRG